jgi:outer membrane protein
MQLSVLTALLFGATLAQADERIVAVNSDRILKESALATAAQAKLKAEFKSREDALTSVSNDLTKESTLLDKNGASMSDADRLQLRNKINDLNVIFQRKRREFEEDLNQRRNEELANVLDQANKVIKQLAEKNHYDLIVQEGVYVNPRIDITNDVLKAIADIAAGKPDTSTKSSDVKSGVSAGKSSGK